MILNLYSHLVYSKGLTAFQTLTDFLPPIHLSKCHMLQQYATRVKVNFRQTSIDWSSCRKNVHVFISNFNHNFSMILQFITARINESN